MREGWNVPEEEKRVRRREYLSLYGKFLMVGSGVSKTIKRNDSQSTLLGL